ncbi:MAG: hypothetical protein F6K22_25720 [Okeania sp. SIO2F4]|uniref:hypothetical protein n=1 Tax=Okeania sp. SIO2F4 TaxID=2607790 RepID=UPI00142C2C86|nr:hypothetical protein [Okeania sp. SIO2F4]NES05904.1 hypothetical protein [Okeania sp. SIO2F4]
MVAILADVFAAKSLLKLPTKNCLIREEELSNFDSITRKNTNYYQLWCGSKLLTQSNSRELQLNIFLIYQPTQNTVAIMA